MKVGQLLDLASNVDLLRSKLEGLTVIAELDSKDGLKRRFKFTLEEAIKNGETDKLWSILYKIGEVSDDILDEIRSKDALIK